MMVTWLRNNQTFMSHARRTELSVLWQPRSGKPLNLLYRTFCLSGVGMTVPSFIEMYVSLLRLGLEQVD